MTRQEMLDKIIAAVNSIPKEVIESDKFEEALAETVLTTCEDAGMLPPVTKTGRDNFARSIKYRGWRDLKLSTNWSDYDYRCCGWEVKDA